MKLILGLIICNFSFSALADDIWLERSNEIELVIGISKKYSDALTDAGKQDALKFAETYCRRGAIIVRDIYPMTKVIEEKSDRIDLSGLLNFSDSLYGTSYSKGYSHKPVRTRLFQWMELKISCDMRSSSSNCCKVCSTGKACGDSCIDSEKLCHVGIGCACDR